MPQDFAPLFAKAQEAGRKAAEAAVPRPMVVVKRENPFDDNSPIVKQYAPDYDGVCGFAWVKFPGNSAFGRWAKAQGVARKGYPKGLQVWISDYQQSFERKLAHARAMAGVLVEAGIDAYAEGRLD